MAKNVSYQTQLDGKSSGVISSKAINEPTKSRYQNSNSFDLDYYLYCTQRYGDLTPFYVANGVPKDINPLINSHELRTYTLQAPMMSDIFMHKNYFQVPMKAILPNTWDLIFKNPVQGDDVPSDAYCSFDIYYQIRYCLNLLMNSYRYQRVTLTSSNYAHWFGAFLRQMVFLEMFFSSGSLLTYLGFPCHGLFGDNGKSHSSSFDNFMDEVVFPIVKEVPFFYIKFGSRTYTLDTFDVNTTVPKISYTRLFELLRENPDFDLIMHETSEASSAFITRLNEVLLPDFGDKFKNLYDNLVEFSSPIDMSRVVAYQLVCAHFYSNDSVDFIYSADLYLDNLRSFAESYLTGGDSTIARTWYFKYNGVKIHYDVCSAKVMSAVFTQLQNLLTSMIPVNFASDLTKYVNALSYYHLLFGLRKSLKYGDYFTGSRPHPLAVGDISAPVVSNSVSAIDMTVNISKQRFLNAVNRFGASVDDYISGIFDSKLPPVDTDPKWLANQTFKLFGTEIENTGSEQRNNNSVTTLLKSSDGRYAFEAYADVPCIFIGISWFEIRRAYSTASERFMYHSDRFDMFNPYLQYIGDQEIYSKEISVSNLSNVPFAYTGRYMEYKQRFDRAVGGFVTSALRSWATVVNPNDDSDHQRSIVLSPDFIRSSNSEFDQYYSSLSSISLGNYFHFIVKYCNFNNIKRAMDYNPTIL